MSNVVVLGAMISKTEEVLVAERAVQLENVQSRISELKASDNPIAKLQESYSAHKSCGFDEHFEDAIDELKTSARVQAKAAADKLAFDAAVKAEAAKIVAQMQEAAKKQAEADAKAKAEFDAAVAAEAAKVAAQP